MDKIEEKFTLLERKLEDKLTDIDIKIEQIRNNIFLKLEDKVPFKFFVILVSLIIGNFGFQWAIYEKTLQIEYATKKSLVEFNIKIENTQKKIVDLRKAIRRRKR